MCNKSEQDLSAKQKIIYMLCACRLSWVHLRRRKKSEVNKAFVAAFILSRALLIIIRFFLNLCTTFFVTFNLFFSAQVKPRRREACSKNLFVNLWLWDCIKSCHEHFLVVSSSQAKQLKEHNTRLYSPLSTISSSSTIFLLYTFCI